MRVHLQISHSISPVPFNYMENLVGAFHKWMGWNSIHDDISLYSLSWLKGGKLVNGNLLFPNGSEWFISFYDESLIKKLVNGILESPEIAFGMRVNKVFLQMTPVFSSSMYFQVASPVLLKQNIKNSEKQKFFLFDDIESDSILTRILKRKLKKAGLSDENVHVSFDRSYPLKKTKKVTYKGIENRASLCPIKIEGNPEQIAFAWNVGVGNSTGIGFGSLI